MPLKLVDPRPGKSPNFTIRGTYLGIGVDQTAGTTSRSVAQQILNRIKKEIETGAFQLPGEATFATAAESYLNAGGEDRFMRPLVEHFLDKPLRHIDQAAVDAAAVALYPDASPATRNRQVYTPVVAILSHAKVAVAIRRPRGAQGRQRQGWLWPEDFARLQAAARAEDPELAVLVTLLAYTGLRLSEALRIECKDIQLEESFLYCGMTKNGDPRPVHLPPVVVAALREHPKGLARDGRLFRFVKNKWLYGRAERAYKAAGVSDNDAPFHLLRHTYGAWMRRAGADLVGTGAWKSKGAASVYEHVVVSEEAKKADLLPVPKARES